MHPGHPKPNASAKKIAELCVYLHVAKAHLLDLMREFDEKGCWEELGFPSCVLWLDFQCGIGANAAREHLRVAHAPVLLPKIAETYLNHPENSGSTADRYQVVIHTRGKRLAGDSYLENVTRSIVCLRSNGLGIRRLGNGKR